MNQMRRSGKLYPLVVLVVFALGLSPATAQTPCTGLNPVYTPDTIPVGGTTGPPTITFTPSGCAQPPGDVGYGSGSPGIADVDFTGVVFGNMPGTAEIFVFYTSTGLTGSDLITATSGPPTPGLGPANTGVTCDGLIVIYSQTISAGETTGPPELIGLPPDCTLPSNIRYSSVIPNIATVDPTTGVVTGIAEGIAIILVTTDSTDIGSASINVTPGTLPPTSPGPSPPPEQFTVTIVGAGSGSGLVIDFAHGINCTVRAGTTSGACTATVPSGTTLMIDATVIAGALRNWLGCDTASIDPSHLFGFCTVSLTTALTVWALFTGAGAGDEGPAAPPPAGPSAPPAEVVFCGNVQATIVGTPGNDVLVGTNDADVIAGRGGNDRIDGLGGDDLLCGEEGNDTLRGGAGNDVLLGGPGNDDLFSGLGNDRLDGGMGSDVLDGDLGNDLLEGGPGGDGLSGGQGNDTLNGSDEADWLDGGDGDDTLDGGDGDDMLFGGLDDDTLQGGEGNDFLDGGEGNDILAGGPDQDHLRGGKGNDTLGGEDGDDELVGGPGDDVLRGDAGFDEFDGGPGIDSCQTAPGEFAISCER